MSRNTYKKKGKGDGKSIFSRFESTFRVEDLFEDGFPVEHLPRIIFVIFICIFYIGNTHYAEKNIRKIESLKTEVEDLRADYTTLKADYMFTSKQSEVARKVKEKGLEESLQPPKKIIVTED